MTASSPTVNRSVGPGTEPLIERASRGSPPRETVDSAMTSSYSFVSAFAVAVALHHARAEVRPATRERRR
jgi:hypothetical protein